MQKNNLPKPCQVCPNRIENLSDEQRQLADSGGAVIAFCHQSVYFASNGASTHASYEELAKENPALMTAIGECAAQNSPPTKSRSLREKLFGPRRDDIRPDCGALVMLATEAETANV